MATVTVPVPRHRDGNAKRRLARRTMFSAGDLIQFNCQGPYLLRLPARRSTDPRPLTMSPVSTLNAHLRHNPGATGAVAPRDVVTAVPYRIFRAPIKGAASPLQLPAPRWSICDGPGRHRSIRRDVVSLATVPLNQDVSVLFSPNGGVDQRHTRRHVPAPSPSRSSCWWASGSGWATPPQTPPTTANQSQWANWQDLDNIWVVVNPQTGLVTADNMAVVAGNDVNAARSLARDAQGMGGK